MKVSRLGHFQQPFMLFPTLCITSMALLSPFEDNHFFLTHSTITNR